MQTGAHARRGGVAASRLAQGAITAVFVVCIVEVWRAAVTGRAGWPVAVAAGLLAVEGVLVATAGGHCPLAPVWRRLGDETPFFDVLVGPALGRRAIPFLGLVVLAGGAVLVVRLAWS